MKRHLFLLPARFALLLIVFTAFKTGVRAQCSASIPSGNQTVCAGASVSIPVTLSGTEPYTFFYQINGAPQIPVTTSLVNYNLVLTGFSQQSVVVLSSMTDGTGCQGAVSGAVTIEVHSEIAITVNTTPVSCNGGQNGHIDITVTGGTPAYAYLWSTGSTAQDMSGLPAGTYSVTVSDANGCTKFVSVSVTQPTPILAAPAIQPPTCGNNEGSIDISVSGGTAPYQYLWSTGSVLEDLAGLGTGTYTVTITDANGCTISMTRSIGPYEANIAVSTSQCLGNLDLSVAGGAEPYTYLWSDNSTTEDLTGVSGGTYSVTITDQMGCSVVSAASVDSLPPIEASITAGYTPCAGGLFAQMTGSSPTGTTYVWSTGHTTAFLTNIPAGTYIVTVTANTTCSATATITIGGPLTNSQLNITSSGVGVTCFGASTGSINLTVAGWAPPFTFLWSNGATTEDLTNVSANTYTVTVTDFNGCTRTASRLVTQPAAFNVSWVVSNSNCNANSGNIDLIVSGGIQPYMYTWRNQSNDLISNAQDLNNMASGIYKVTITDANGCIYTSSDIQVQPSLSAEIEYLPAQCSSAVLASIISGGTPPYQYAWVGPNNYSSNTINITVSESGNYTVVVVDANGCTAQADYDVILSANGPCSYLSGRVLRDDIVNCLADPGEAGLGGWLVRAESAADTFYGVTNFQGNYWVGVSIGTYTMAVLPPNALWEACPVGPAVTVDMPADTQPGGDLLVKSLYSCPSLSVTIGVSLLRRCFANNYYYVSYCNQGTAPVADAYILITLDPFLDPISANIPYSDLGGGLLRFDVGNLAVGQCGTFQLRVEVSCNAAFGQTHCTEAHIYPDGDCLPTNPNWSGASLRLTSQCSQDSVRFTIQNIGTGDMEESSDYIVVEDAVMLMRAPFQLTSGASTVVSTPANGSTWRIEVEQALFHPGLSEPVLSVEGCTTAPSFSMGFVNQFPNNEGDPWIDIDCTQNIGSYDPNDKQGFPLGYGTERYIHPGTELEYLIRFQNTGTDTAFTVRITDTLSLWLDPASIRPGVSSHPYQFNFTGQGIAEFLFENILLPDSNVNEAASNGFVKFSVYPRADAPLETLIENSAAIYFDFNEPVITNTTRHRLGENFLMTVGAWQPNRPEYQVLVSPNPFSASALLEVKGLTSSLPVHLQVIDLQGKIVYEETASGPVLHLKKGSLKTGMYLFRLDQKGVMIGSGKLVVRD